MDIQLPDRVNNQEALILKDVRQMTIIGANGSGKSRFTKWLIDKYQDRACILSAIKALFPTLGHNDLIGSIDNRFDDVIEKSSYLRADAPTEFSRLIFLLLHDEFLDLMKYKTQILLGEGAAKVPQTRLDKVAKMWQEVFPNNKILRDGGKILFSNNKSEQPFSSLRLSDSEKAVLYYLGAVMYARKRSIIFVEDPEIYIHHSTMQALWNVIEEMRPDCTFIYETHDIEFASSRIDNRCVWVRNYDYSNQCWDYELVNPSDTLSDELYYDLLGSRKPIMFVEGDSSHSIDSKLYALIFPEYTVKPLGSCNKVIESTRAFNDLRSFHHLDSHGIVDRDRRDVKEVEYLRDKKIFVPNVAEIENILMLEGVIRAVARYYGKDDNRVFTKVRASVMKMFRNDLDKQVLEHVRHRVKRTVEVRIDGRFHNIGELEQHMIGLVDEINPQGIYDKLHAAFEKYVNSCDYASVLRVYNEKTMLPDSNVAQLCGLNSKQQYINSVLYILKTEGEEAENIRKAIKNCFGIDYN